MTDSKDVGEPDLRSLVEEVSKIIETRRSSTDGPQRDDWQRGYAAACRELRDRIIPLLQGRSAAPTSDLEMAGNGRGLR